MENEPTLSSGKTKMGRDSKCFDTTEKKNKKNRKIPSGASVYYLNASKDVIKALLNGAEKERASIVFPGENETGRILLSGAEAFQFTMCPAGEEDSENLGSSRVDALRRSGVIVGDVNISEKSSESLQDAQEDATNESMETQGDQ